MVTTSVMGQRDRAPDVERDPRWRAVCARDAAMDGRFWFSVATTGVYCRPSCPSRRARPENVAFHASPADARRAGFRACLRCRPDEPAGPHAAAITELCRLLEASEERPSLSELGARVGLSPFHLQRVFKQAVGLSPAEYFAACRARRARAAVPTAGSVTEAIHAAGYGSTSRFYEAGALGMTPSRYRAGGEGEDVRFAIARSSLGLVLVAATARGVCEVALGDDRAALTEGLRARFPRARIARGDAPFERLVARVIARIEDPRAAGDLPLDVRGTAFQERVWRALAAIPAGETRTYTEVAEAIGAPRSARAVARACATNTIAVLVPCHRVVREGGALAGYRWGVPRKRALIAREAERSRGPGTRGARSRGS